MLGGTALTNLVAVATDDDSGDYHTSYVTFNAIAGTAYQIYVGSLDQTGGTSMGAFIARHYALRHADTLSGLVISATGVRLGAVAKIARAIARFDARRIGPRAPSKLMAALSFGSFNLKFFPARTRSDWLSRDSNEVDRYIADPLCGFTCSAQFWISSAASSSSKPSSAAASTSPGICPR